jgi:electron transport complex protein RnfB
MHTIIAAECTGCELCVAPCPVDCIDMVVIEEKITNWKWKYPVYTIASLDVVGAALQSAPGRASE